MAKIAEANPIEAEAARFLNVGTQKEMYAPNTEVQYALYAGLIAARAAGYALPDNRQAQDAAIAAAIGGAAGVNRMEYIKSDKAAVTKEMVAKPGHYAELIEAARDTTPKDYSTQR
jgi:hypothetical protein